MKEDEIKLIKAPEIKRLRFRSFAGEADFPKMVQIIDKASEADQDDYVVTLNDIKNSYKHLSNCDPHKDMIFTEVDGRAVAYSRVEWWQEDNPNDRIYMHFVNIIPEWRNNCIEQAMIGWCETRLRDIAAVHPKDSKRYFQTGSNSLKPGFSKILETLEYKTVRFFIEMSRSLENIPAANLPEGIDLLLFRRDVHD